MDTPREALVWRARFLTLFDRSPLPTAISRVDGTVTGANPAFAALWDTRPGRVQGRALLDLFTPTDAEQLRKLDRALRSGRRSRYPVRVTWCVRGTRRAGEVTVEPVSDPLEDEPPLLVTLTERTGDGDGPANGTDGSPRAAGGAGREALAPRGRPGEATEEDARRLGLSPQEARILPLIAAGATTAGVGRTVGIGTDGVNYHLGRLCRRLGVPNRTALVAKAYALGLLEAGVWPPVLAAPGGVAEQAVTTWDGP
ncbi:helix-turn-helix transcriptional regulator [Streptomyces sp. URMC 123]|uniref:helix-turn-helix transcriptional regulator n=1 Tax=Streptomyces sp. URMC 123 TaxID=3423403 RepID=UPI003F1CCD53